jgi:hypothetical protein
MEIFGGSPDLFRRPSSVGVYYYVFKIKQNLGPTMVLQFSVVFSFSSDRSFHYFDMLVAISLTNFLNVSSSGTLLL